MSPVHTGCSVSPVRESRGGSSWCPRKGQGLHPCPPDGFAVLYLHSQSKVVFVNMGTRLHTGAPHSLRRLHPSRCPLSSGRGQPGRTLRKQRPRCHGGCHPPNRATTLSQDTWLIFGIAWVLFASPPSPYLVVSLFPSPWTLSIPALRTNNPVAKQPGILEAM